MQLDSDGNQHFQTYFSKYRHLSTFDDRNFVEMLEDGRMKYKLSPDKNAHLPSHGEMQHNQAVLVRKLDSWHESFQNLRSARQLPPDSISYLLMYYHSSVIWLSVRLAPDQTVYDTVEITEHFERLLDSSEAYIGARTMHRPFTAESGTTSMINLAALKCRVPWIRRRALWLLAIASRLKGSKPPDLSAEIARRIVAIEEEGLGLPEPGFDDGNALKHDLRAPLPQEESRAQSILILEDEQTGRPSEVRVARVIDGCLQYWQNYPI